MFSSLIGYLHLFHVGLEIPSNLAVCHTLPKLSPADMTTSFSVNVSSSVKSFAIIRDSRLHSFFPLADNAQSSASGLGAAGSPLLQMTLISSRFYLTVTPFVAALRLGVSQLYTSATDISFRFYYLLVYNSAGPRSVHVRTDDATG